MTNISRRGFLASLLACAVSGTILTDADLLSAAPSENQYTEVVKLARQIASMDFYQPRTSEREVAIERLFQTLKGFYTNKVVISINDQELLASQKPDPEWGMMDETELEKLSRHLVPYAIVEELLSRCKVTPSEERYEDLSFFDYSKYIRNFNEVVLMEVPFEMHHGSPISFMHHRALSFMNHRAAHQNEKSKKHVDTRIGVCV